MEEKQKSLLELKNSVTTYNNMLIKYDTAKKAFIKAATEKEKKTIEAEAAAAEKTIAAEAEAEAIKTKADAQADANKKIRDSLSEEVLENKKLETWDGVLPKVSTGSGASIIVDAID